jgi:hypothetical protein
VNLKQKYYFCIYKYRDEEVEHGMALMPKLPAKEGVESEEDYDPHKHRNVPHPTS